MSTFVLCEVCFLGNGIVGNLVRNYDQKCNPKTKEIKYVFIDFIVNSANNL